MDKNFEIEINSKHQLLDLNADKINFDLNFKVESKSNDEFHALVLSKNELDNYQDLNDIQMKDAPGIIKGNIKSTDNNYQNYFLILKKMDGSTKATVNIQLEELEYDGKNNNNNNLLSPTTDSVKGENRLLNLYNEYFYHILLFLFVAGVISLYFTFRENGREKDRLQPINENTFIAKTSPSLPNTNTPDSISTNFMEKSINPVSPEIITPSISAPVVENLSSQTISNPIVVPNPVSENLPTPSISNIASNTETISSLPDKITDYLNEIENPN